MRKLLKISFSLFFLNFDFDVLLFSNPLASNCIYTKVCRTICHIIFIYHTFFFKYDHFYLTKRHMLCLIVKIIRKFIKSSTNHDILKQMSNQQSYLFNIKQLIVSKLFLLYFSHK
jgi:hypothetical protein